jgi:hypothetical protein
MGSAATRGLQASTSSILNGAERGPSPGGMGTVRLGNTSFKVYKGNFKRLAMGKARIYSNDYFRCEQSIQPLDNHLFLTDVAHARSC